MNGFYYILLFLFCFGAVTQGVNELAIFDYTVPTNGAQISNQTVRDIQSGSEQTALNPFNAIMVLVSFMKIIGMGVVAMFTIIPVIVEIFTMVGMDMGTALIMAGMIQAPVTFVTLFGLFEWWTGRSVA
jgi:hypothetical protein